MINHIENILPSKTARGADMTLRKIAIIAGFAFLIMTIAAGFAYGFVLGKLIVPGDAAATANKIMASVMLYRTRIFSLLIVLICDVVVAWALYVFLKPVNKSLSLKLQSKY